MCSYNHKQNKIWKFPYISVCLLTFPVWSLILLATDSNCSFFCHYKTRRVIFRTSCVFNYEIGSFLFMAYFYQEMLLNFSDTL